MTPRFAATKKTRTGLILLACMLFYAAQASAQLHGIAHLFHDADETCVHFDSVDHHKSGFVHDFVVVLIEGGFEHFQQPAYDAPLTGRYRSWQPRAPPFLFAV